MLRIKSNYQFDKLFFYVFFSCFLCSCASLKNIISLQDLTPDNIEPRVSFIDEKQVNIKPSQIKMTDADQVIASYQRLLNRGNSEIRKEALLYLAELSMQLSEAKLTSDSTQPTSTQPTSTQQTLPQQPGVSKAMDEASFAQAINYYQTLLNEYPEHPKKDQISYQLARAHSLNAEPETSLKILDQISNVHVGSDSYVESQFRRGESYFVRKNYATAEQAYAEVLNVGINTEFYDKALYKKGWSLFKQSLFLEAQADFFKLYEKIIKERQSAAESSGLMADLLADTSRAISLGFYNMDGAESVQQHFSNSGKRDYENKIYDSLSKLYIEQERYQDAANTYLAFIKSNPLSLFSPDFHSEIIEIYKKGGFPSLILPAKENFVVNYGRQSIFWQNHGDSVIEGLKPILKKHLEDISTFYHAKAQSSTKAADYLIAAKWYQEILATFNTPQVDSKFRFLLAETLEGGARHEQAAKEYEIVAYGNELSPFSRDAGYRALVAFQNVNYPKGSTDLEKNLPLIQSGLKFVETFSTDPKSIEIIARVAEQQLSIKDIQGAIDSSNKLLLLVSTSGSDKFGQQQDRSRVIIANGLFDLKQYQQAEIAISQLLKTANLTQKERNLFIHRRSESLYKLAEEAKLANDFPLAIKLFLQVKDYQPSSDIAIKAHFDAATLLLQSGSWDQSAQLFSLFRNRYPKNSLTPSIAEKLALVYEKQQNWNKAADEYKTLAINQSDPNLAREGYWQVSQLYLKANNFDKAIESFKYYVWTYPEPYLLAQEARSQLVQLYLKETNADESKSNFWRQQIIGFYAKNKQQNNARTAALAAESEFVLSEKLFETYKNIKLNLPLDKSLKKKRTAMKNALNAYNSIATYNVAAYTTASTHKVASIYQILSNDLMQSQKPKGLDPEELEEYGFLLEEQALPFEDKAIEYFEINAQRTKDLIYDKSVKASIDSLRKLKPIQFDKNEYLEELSNVAF